MSDEAIKEFIEFAIKYEISSFTICEDGLAKFVVHVTQIQEGDLMLIIRHLDGSVFESYSVTRTWEIKRRM